GSAKPSAERQVTWVGWVEPTDEPEMRTILVIGGGPAGTLAAIAAKKQDPAAAVTLLTLEPCEPYEKPPLSKAVLLGDVMPGDALIAGPRGVAGHDVALQTLSRCTATDRFDRAVVLDAAHSRYGVDIRVGTTLAAAAPQADGRIAAQTGAGDQVIADLVVVGTGSKPDAALAAAAGLATDDGIVVDAQCRTSDPAIFAAGDAVRFPGPHGLVRMENWRHAQDQGAVAGRNAAGASDTYATVPSFWSEQYDLYIQGVGWPVQGITRV